MKSLIALATIILSCTACNSHITGTPLDNIFRKTSTCAIDFSVDNQSQNPLEISTLVGEDVSDAHCDNAEDQHMTTVPAGAQGQVHAELKCESCSPLLVEKSSSVGPQGSLWSGKDAHVICTGTGCAAAP